MVKIKFVVVLLSIAPIALCSTVNNTSNIKINSVSEVIKHLKVMQRNFSTYNELINTTNELELNFKQKNILISSNIEGNFSLEKAITDIQNEYEDESVSAWNNKISHWDYMFIAPLKDKSYFKMDWREYIAHNIFFLQYKTEPFINISPNISIKNKNILGTNENFYNITADIIYTKDGKTPYLFDDINELRKNLTQTFNTDNVKGPLSSISTIQLNVLQYSDILSTGYLKMLDCNSIVGDIECDTYSLANMFATKYITENTARFGITDAFRINDYEAHKHFNDLINNKLKFKLSYKTTDVNDENKFVNVSKTFLYDGMNLNIDLPINHGIFIPCSIESFEYSDDTIYIQPDYAKLN